jgi:hypothetical protein
MSISIYATNQSPQSSPRSSDTSTNRLLFIGFNEKQTHFACGTETGFFICKCHPYKEEAMKSNIFAFFEVNFFADFSDGGIGVVEIVDKQEHIVVLVGGGPRPAFPLNKLVFYNYETKTLKGEMLCRQNILCVKKRSK